jgi:hypothetical protein
MIYIAMPPTPTSKILFDQANVEQTPILTSKILFDQANIE